MKQSRNNQQAPAIKRASVLLLKLLLGAAAIGALPSSLAIESTTADTKVNASPSVSAPALLLAQNYTQRDDVAAFLVSEKLDGVRAYWDGHRLMFRSGREIHAPAWFIAALPRHPVDGELWMGRHQFEKLSAAVRRQEPNDQEWKRISYQLFESPGAAGSFTERIETLQASVRAQNVAWLQVVPQTKVENHSELRKRLAEVVDGGGEGLVLHRADALWHTGRSAALLKLKPLDDADATVIAHEPGKGKYRGLLGALLVQTKDGKQFRLGTGFDDALRKNPPKIGTLVTYRYRDITSTGLPKFASFLRVRDDE